MNPQFKLFINTPAADLRGLQTHSGNRFVSAAAGQVLSALEAKALGDTKMVAVYLQKAQGYWLRSQECEQDQTRRAVERIAQLRADGVARDVVESGATHSGPHMSMGDSYVRNGQARGEKAVRS